MAHSGANSMLFWSFFRSLAFNNGNGQDEQGQLTGPLNLVRITIELKNGVKVEGNLEQVDEQMNFHLSDIKLLQTVGSTDKQVPHFSMCSSTFIRGNVIRFVHLNKGEVDTDPLTEACRNEVKRSQQQT